MQVPVAHSCTWSRHGNPFPQVCYDRELACHFGMGRRTTYDELGLGNLKAIKVGARTLIDVEAGLAWLRSRPAAVIRGPRIQNFLLHPRESATSHT